MICSLQTKMLNIDHFSNVVPQKSFERCFFLNDTSCFTEAFEELKIELFLLTIILLPVCHLKTVFFECF